MDTAFETLIGEIVALIRDAGYEPYDQLYGYISTGKEEFITRKGQAREKVKALSLEELKEFVEKMDHN